MKQVIWTYFATSELKNIYLFHKLAASPRIAEKIKKSIFNVTKKLLISPMLGQIEDSLIDLKQGHRYIVEGNYKIIYRVLGDEIYIVDVFDCRQNPQKIKRHSK
jgi:plasmid stabilization system protein ParE